MKLYERGCRRSFCESGMFSSQFFQRKDEPIKSDIPRGCLVPNEKRENTFPLFLVSGVMNVIISSIDRLSDMGMMGARIIFFLGKSRGKMGVFLVFCMKRRLGRIY